MKNIALTTLIVLMSVAATFRSAAAADDCLPSAKAVHSAHPGSHAMWSDLIPGHKGERCYFAKTRRPVHVDPTPIPRPAPAANYGNDTRQTIAAATIDDAKFRMADDQTAVPQTPRRLQGWEIDSFTCHVVSDFPTPNLDCSSMKSTAPEWMFRKKVEFVPVLPKEIK